MTDHPYLQDVVNGFIACMLWSSTDERDAPLDQTYDVDDIAPETLDKATDYCRAFLGYAGDKLTDESFIGKQGGITSVPVRAGHDLWLTQAGHGAGFWDGDWNEAMSVLGCNFTEAAKTLEPYVGDDGKIYFF